MRPPSPLLRPLLLLLVAFGAALPALADCAPDAHTLCLLDGRFRVRVSWRDQHHDGATGEATAVPLTAKSGAFWFFDAANYEVMVKVLDGRVVNGRFWIFLGSLSDVEYWVDVDDTVAGLHQSYRNPPGNRYGIADTMAFDDGATACDPGDHGACAEGSFCELPAATCAVPGLSGSCVVRPEGCAGEYDPVCGCDGLTYGNDCERQRAGVSKDHDGACRPAGASCGGFVGYACDAGLFCDFLAGTCGIADAPGVCVDPPDPSICQIFDPPGPQVCGCDGTTYYNDCARQAAEVSKLHDGAC
jgi:Kazal-type serine protease inhibitor domain